jgi:GTP cyclohydrolase III
MEKCNTSDPVLQVLQLINDNSKLCIKVGVIGVSRKAETEIFAAKSILRCFIQANG